MSKHIVFWTTLLFLISLLNCCSTKEEAEFIKLFKQNRWRLIVKGINIYQEYLLDCKKFKPIQKTSEFKKARPDFFSLGNFDINPGGINIVFIVNNFKEPDEMILVDKNFEKPETLIKMQKLSNPIWSNDGSKIAFTGIPNSIDKNDLSKNSLFLYDLHSKNLTTLVKGYVLDFSSYDKNISWHPDNRTVFFASRDDIIKCVNIDTLEIKTICNGVYPKISPDGGRLIFRKDFKDEKTGQLKGVEFYLLDLNTNEQTGLIVNADSVNWSPDGNYLLIISFFSDIGDSHKARIMNLNNRKIFTLGKYLGYEAASWGFQPTD